MAIRDRLVVYLQDFISLIYPRICVNCTDALFHHENVLCTVCRLNLPKSLDHLTDNNGILSKFVFEPRVFFATTYLTYRPKGVAQKLVRELKYKGNQDVGTYLGQWFAVAIKDSLPNFDMIVPVPLHPKKKAIRGYNQAEILAESMSLELGILLNTQ